MTWPMLAMLPPREGQAAWSAGDIRRVATRIVATRVAIASASIASVFVAVMSCGLLLENVAFADQALAFPTRAELWAVFQRAGLSEALVALPMATAVLVYAFRATTTESALRRAFLGAIGAAALHIPLWPISFHLVGLGLEGLGAPRSSVSVGTFLCPTIVMCWPLGAGFGAVYALAVKLLREGLDPPSGSALKVARWTGVLFVAVALSALIPVALGNRLELYWVAAPASVLMAVLALDLAMILFLGQRARRWLAAVRAGRSPEWALVEASAAYVADDLVPLAPARGPMLALVRRRADTYRDLPRAVALVPSEGGTP